MEETTKKTIENLRAHSFSAEYVSSKEEAKDLVLDLIAPDRRVGVGGTVTVRELGLIEALKDRGHTVYDHWEKGLSPEEVHEMRIKQQTCDLFLTSVNAVTKRGELVSVDGAGNRLSAMLFGPKAVIIVAGVNKIVEDIPEALERIRNVAAPLNARRLGRRPPCTETGECSDCESPQRICRSTLIMERQSTLTDVTVVLVGEKLGY